jgi:carboxyl-terminal processing protease
MYLPGHPVSQLANPKGLKMKRWAVVVLPALAVMALGLASGIAVDRLFLLQHEVPIRQDAEFPLLGEALRIIDDAYVDRNAIQPQALSYGAISGMVDALGDTGHSVFLTPSMVKAEQDELQGQFEGIGAEVRLEGGNVVIAGVLGASPAQRAGLHRGEIILQVDGLDAPGLGLSETIRRIRGAVGTSVVLTILDPVTNQTSHVMLLRDRITLQNVTWQRIPGADVAHLRVAAFSKGTAAALQQALAAIQDERLGGVILDLRDDPGGLLDESVATASQFLSSGNVLLEKDAKGTITPVPVQRGAVAPELPMVVLVDGATASAAEIVAGALQDAHRAKVVGETSFGTGTVLNEFSLSDGSALLLATQEWLTPSGRVIWHLGIEPDVKVPLDPQAMALSPQDEQSLSPEQLHQSSDSQLLAALNLLPP